MSCSPPLPLPSCGERHAAPQRTARCCARRGTRGACCEARSPVYAARTLPGARRYPRLGVGTFALAIGYRWARRRCGRGRGEGLSRSKTRDERAFGRRVAARSSVLRPSRAAHMPHAAHARRSPGCAGATFSAGIGGDAIDVPRRAPVPRVTGRELMPWLCSSSCGARFDGCDLR
eukprot:1407402-Prymnesium_polylepis.1